MNNTDRMRNVCITLNNWTQDEYEALLEEKTSYIVIGKEGKYEGHTPHLQVYIEFEKQARFSTFKKRHPRAHIAERGEFSTPEIASNYCKKGEQPKEEWNKLKTKGPNYGLDADFIERGTLSKQGKRTDIEKASDRIQEGTPIKQIAKEFPSTFVKFHKGLTALHNAILPHRTERPCCIWIYGPTGTGKTWRAKQLGKNYFIKDNTRWWADYDQQEVVIIDDFRKDDIPLQTLLKILDENEMSVEIKGGYIPLNSPYIVITCDKGPHQYWSGNDYDQIKRRLNGGIHYCTEITTQEKWNNELLSQKFCHGSG